MKQIHSDKLNNLKPPVYSSLAMAFAGVGDAFLYPFLPLYATTIGIPMIWVGFLLSVNRFARIILNPIVVKSFDHLNVKSVTILASALAVLSTIGYGLNLGLIAWIAFRITWGLSFSALRISTATYALNHQNKGLALGLSNGLYELGPLIAFTFSPFIVLNFTIENSFFILAAISSFALVFAFKTPYLEKTTAHPTPLKLRRISQLNLLSFSTAFIAEGIIITTITIFMQRHYDLPILKIAAIASGYLLFRRICSLVISPISGTLTDRFGFRKVLVISFLMVTIGIVLLINNIVIAGLILIFGFSAINNVVLPIGATAKSGDTVRAIAQNSLFRDSGAAFGTLLGGFLLLSPHLNMVLSMCAIIQVIFVTYYIKTDKPG